MLEAAALVDPHVNSKPVGEPQRKYTGRKQKLKKTQLKCVDLFAGCGGMSKGFELAGYDIVAAFENWRPAAEVYESNFEHPVHQMDLSDVQAACQAIEPYKPELIIGGPPCQDFSTAGRRNEDGGRAILSVKYSEIVTKIRPQYFVMENVSTIHNTKSFKDAIRNFKKAGYGVTIQVLNAAYCGVPQTRKRMFVVGSLNSEDQFLTDALLGNLSKNPMTIHDYLGDSLGVEHYFRVPTNYTRRAVFSIHEPSVTIRAVDRPIPKGYLGNPRDSAPVETVRALTPTERSYLQTFPKEFIFHGGKSNINAMIGNAVPVNLAKYVANALLQHHANTEERA